MSDENAQTPKSKDIIGVVSLSMLLGGSILSLAVGSGLFILLAFASMPLSLYGWIAAKRKNKSSYLSVRVLIGGVLLLALVGAGALTLRIILQS